MLDPLPSGAIICRYYALKVRLTGPGGAPNEIDTAMLGVNSQAVNLDPTAVRIVWFGAQYAGHGVVNVSWQSGVEGGIRGFRVTRAPTADGLFVAVSGLVPAEGDAHVYSVTDSLKASVGRTYFYQLLVLGADGSVTSSSPAAATLPGRRRRASPSIR